METTFENIYTLLKSENLSVKDVLYSITPYSLNTRLSFKFNDADDLKAFLAGEASLSEEDAQQVDKMILDAGLKPETFFYVNFYKKKITEL
ncbi:MAG: hypothetical protein ACLGH8_09410 [Bacteroidia bacterium]